MMAETFSKSALISSGKAALLKLENSEERNHSNYFLSIFSGSKGDSLAAVNSLFKSFEKLKDSFLINLYIDYLYIINDLSKNLSHPILSLHQRGQMPQDRPESEYSDDEIFTDEEETNEGIRKIPRVSNPFEKARTDTVEEDESELEGDYDLPFPRKDCAADLPFDDEIYPCAEEREESEVVSTDEENKNGLENRSDNERQE